VGSSWLPSDMLAAHLYGQLEVHEKIQATRRGAWDHYYAHLTSWAARHGVQLPTFPFNGNLNFTTPTHMPKKT